eukprot:scaffold66749_cov51-Phaeocystis_antarctica.AAC.2
MLIDERHHRQHSPTFDERLTYGDTDRNLGHTVNCIPPPPSHAPCGGSDRPLVTFGALHILVTISSSGRSSVRSRRPPPRQSSKTQGRRVSNPHTLTLTRSAHCKRSIAAFLMSPACLPSTEQLKACRIKTVFVA